MTKRKKLICAVIVASSVYGYGQVTRSRTPIVKSQVEWGEYLNSSTRGKVLFFQPSGREVVPSRSNEKTSWSGRTKKDVFSSVQEKIMQSRTLK